MTLISIFRCSNVPTRGVVWWAISRVDSRQLRVLAPSRCRMTCALSCAASHASGASRKPMRLPAVNARAPMSSFVARTAPPVMVRMSGRSCTQTMLGCDRSGQRLRCARQRGSAVKVRRVVALGAGKLHARRRVGALGLYAASRLVQTGATPRLHPHSPGFVFAREILALDADLVGLLLVVDGAPGKCGTKRALLEVSRDPEIAEAARYARRSESMCCT